jgi:hypothetical protein
VDPDRALIDDDRSNNAWLPRVQVVLDSADVAVTSTEFAIAALAVARLRYDYHKDIALTGFYTNRGIGFAIGPRLHFGDRVDGTRFHNNLYFYTFEALDDSFRNDHNRSCAPAAGQRHRRALRLPRCSGARRSPAAQAAPSRLVRQEPRQRLRLFDWGYIAGHAADRLAAHRRRRRSRQWLQ